MNGLTLWVPGETFVQLEPSLNYYRATWWDQVLALYSYDADQSP